MDRIRIAVDVESGDFGPRVIIRGLLEARRISDIPFDAFLCGDRAGIEHILQETAAKSDADRGLLTIEHCTGTIAEGDTRARVWRTRSDSSIVKCISLQKKGTVDASVSAGDTAILMGAALFILGRSAGVLRPALAAFLPTISRRPVLLLDVGANLNCRTGHLVSFAAMGYRYVKKYLSLAEPAIGLLNIGKEPEKGPRVVRDADRELSGRQKGYIGFIEGNRVLSGDADVVVCDGFAGNVLLKACESIHALTVSVLGDTSDLAESIQDRIAVLNPENYGAVPFLGIKGTVLKAHGRSSPQAISNAILAAIAAVGRGAVWSSNEKAKGN